MAKRSNGEGMIRQRADGRWESRVMIGYKDNGKVDDTHFSVTAKVEISEQFFGWILGFGSKAKLVYPDDVMVEFSGYLDRIREMY